MWTWIIIIGSLASIVLAGHMARVRGRSPRTWFWIAFIIAPLAPLVLLIIGDAKRPAQEAAK
jgi:hypothetical protein